MNGIYAELLERCGDAGILQATYNEGFVAGMVVGLALMSFSVYLLVRNSRRRRELKPSTSSHSLEVV